MKKILSLFIAIVLTKIAFSQGKILIRGNTGTSAVTRIVVFPAIKDCLKGAEPIDQIDVDSTGNFQKAITIDKPALIFLTLGGGAETFVTPGDTIDVYEKRSGYGATAFNGTLKPGRDVQVNINGTRPENAFFSLLEARTTKLDRLPFYNDDVLPLFEKCGLTKKLFDERIAFYNYFLVKYSGVSEEFKLVANGEIRGAYFQHLFYLSRYTADSLPKIYLEDVESERFTWKEVNSSGRMLNAARDYFSYHPDTVRGENYLGKEPANKFNLIVNKVNDIQLRDYLLTDLMAFLLKRAPGNYRELFEAYKKTCTNKAYVESVDSAYSTKVVHAR